MVGCVVVRDGILLAEGRTQRCGEDHAEADALRKIDFQAKGATLYVNLEPCCHWGRTPPCTDAIIRSGASRVVVGALDPHPLVNGQGIEVLREAGIEVEVGLHEDAARAVNEAHWISAVERRPFVTLKAALTLDGRTATRGGSSKWITGDAAREHSRRERGLHQAVLVGIGTVLADDPQLNVRSDEGDPSGPGEPVRVVLDSQLRTPPSARLLSSPGGPVWICTTEAAAAGPNAQPLVDAGARLIACPGADRVEISGVLTVLAEEQIATLFVEGGATVHGTFVDAGLVDRWLIYVAPKVFGGVGALPLALGSGVLNASEAIQLEPLAVTHLGNDILIESRSVGGPASVFWAERHGGGQGA